MKTLPYIVFSFLMLCALGTGISSYRRTKSMITQDVNRALEQVLAKMPDNVVATDANNLSLREDSKRECIIS